MSLIILSLILNVNIHNMSSSPAGLSPRVNSARLHQYERQEVWLPCKPIKFEGDRAIVEASDGGQVKIKLVPGVHLTDTSYHEIFGTVIDATTIQMSRSRDLGSDTDLQMINDMVEWTHDERLKERMWRP